MKELKSFTRLVESLRRLPSVGQKSAERMAYALLNMDENILKEFSDSLIDIKKKIHTCPRCGLFTEQELCEICADETRTSEMMIVVSYQKDVQAFEKTERFKGHYHILNGALSATNGIGIHDLAIDSLIKRISAEHVKEIILATEPTLEGETTALFIAKMLEQTPVKITRLAYGLPMGGHLDYADTLTINKAFEGRTKIKE